MLLISDMQKSKIPSHLHMMLAICDTRPPLGYRYYLRSMGENIRKDVSSVARSFPALATDFALPTWLPESVRAPLSPTCNNIKTTHIFL